MADNTRELSQRERDLFSGRDTVDDGPDFDPRPPSRVDRSPDDDRDQSTPGSRTGGSSGGGGGPEPEPAPETETVSGSTSVGAAVGATRPVDRTTTARFDPRRGRLERIATGTTSFRPNPTEAVEPADPFTRAVGSRVEDSDPGRIARTIDSATDAIMDANPAATAAVSGLATSFRSESGVPIPGTDRSLPGRSDFRNFRQELEGPAQRVDSAIGSAVDRTTIDPENAPFELEDIPLNDPTTTAVAATLGTDTGRSGLEAGVERGLQSFNPFRAAQDASLFVEYGVRGTDRVLDADEQEIQTGLDTAEAVGEAGREAGPGLASAAVVRDPSLPFEVGGAATTVFGLGALGPSALSGAGRTSRRVAGDVVDSRSVRRFLDDTRGQQQLIQRGRSRQRSGGGDSDLGPPRPRTDEVRDSAGIRRDRARSGFGQGRDGRLGRSRRRTYDIGDRTFARDPSQPPEPDFSGLASATRRFDGEFETPRDPLDTRGGGFGAVETGATVGGLLSAGQQPDTTGLFDEATAGAIEREIIGETTGQVGGTDADTGTGTDTDVDPFAGTDTTGATEQGVLQGVTARTRLDAGVMGGQLLGADGETGSVIDDPATGDPVPRGVGTPTNAPRPPRSPDIPTLDPDSDEELFAFGTESEDDIFGSGIADASEAAEDFFDR